MKPLSGRRGRVKAMIVKNKKTTIIEKSIQTLSFRSGTVGPHNIAHE